MPMRKLRHSGKSYPGIGAELTSRGVQTKEGGKWLVANLHTSDNIFDNPLLNAAAKTLPWVGGGALLIGALGGWLLGRRGRRA